MRTPYIYTENLFLRFKHSSRAHYVIFEENKDPKIEKGKFGNAKNVDGSKILF